MIDDGIVFADADCPKCGERTYRRDCNSCDGDGAGEHDCGEDCCVCLEPEPTGTCDECSGHGWHNSCRNCGWDLHEQRFLK